MITTGAKLKIGISEYDILHFSYRFKREIDGKGRPYSNYYGGEIEVQVETTDDSELWHYFFSKEMRPVSGCIEVLAGADGEYVRRLTFEKAYIYAAGEEMVSRSHRPMITTIAISPMRLDINDTLRLDRRWPQAPQGWQRYEEKEEYRYTRQAAEEENADKYACSVSFRRCPDYDGSFGFDWLRTGDTGEPGCGWYRNCMFDTQAYDLLASTEYRYFDQAWKKQSPAYRATARYTVPWVTLTEGAKAKFRLKLEVEEPSGTLDIQVTGSKPDALQVNLKTINANKTGDYYYASELEVTCVSAFSSQLAIEVRAKDELVGKMIFVPNNRLYPLEVAVVTVKTQGNDKNTPCRRSPDAAIFEEMKRLLRQAYIVPMFKFYELDLSQPAEYTVGRSSDNIPGKLKRDVKVIEVEKFGGKRVRPELYVEMNDNKPLLNILWKNNEEINTKHPIGILRFISMHNFLNKMLSYTYPSESQILERLYKIYFIDEKIFVANYVGGTSLEADKAACISTEGYNGITATHELLHCLSLEHPFDKKSSYSFRKASTDNMMDYVERENGMENRKSLWYWQLKQIWNKLR